MKKLLGILGVALLLAGCNDSTQDVIGESIADAQAPPDTVIVTDGITVELYFASNPRAIASERELWGDQGVQAVFERLIADGYVPGAEGAWVVRGVTIDGRAAEATMFPFVNPMNEPVGGVVHVLLDGRRFVVPLNIDITDDPRRPGDHPGDGKGDDGPLGTMFDNCLAFARDLLNACLGVCNDSGVPLAACYKSCRQVVMAAFVTCILYTESP
jgi:hypothetical protein